jgi:glycolate oxidase FAD binding subunit
MTHFTPADAHETSEIVTWACAEEEPLELLAGGSKRPFGRPLQVAHALDLSRLSGILDYEPAELVLTAQAATPLAEIEAALIERRQMLAFEPPDWRSLLGTTDRGQTLGGVVACNLAGPRRIAGGAARDHVLGFHAVNGRGERFKAGGKVVKNVTGYDLCKLMAGSHGTLAALTEISVKVLPRPETARTLLFAGLDEAAALRLLAAAMGSPHEVSGAAHLPASVAPRGVAVTTLRLEGPTPSVAHRAAALRRELGEGDDLDADATAAFWRDIGDVSPLAEPRDAAVWRISVPPAAGADVVAAIRREVAAEAFYDWGGGLVWLAVAAPHGGYGAAAIRAACGAIGHATLVRAPEAARAALDVFHPLPAAVAGLSARVKQSFDPRRVLNPGRMYAGI